MNSMKKKLVATALIALPLFTYFALSIMYIVNMDRTQSIMAYLSRTDSLTTIVEFPVPRLFVNRYWEMYILPDLVSQQQQDGSVFLKVTSILDYELFTHANLIDAIKARHLADFFLCLAVTRRFDDKYKHDAATASIMDPGLKKIVDEYFADPKYCDTHSSAGN